MGRLLGQHIKSRRRVNQFATSNYRSVWSFVHPGAVKKSSNEPKNPPTTKVSTFVTSLSAIFLLVVTQINAQAKEYFSLIAHEPILPLGTLSFSAQFAMVGRNSPFLFPFRFFHFLGSMASIN